MASRWDRFWFAEASLVRLGAFRALVMLLVVVDLLAYAGTNLADARAVSEGAVAKPWTPIYLFEVLGLEPIGLGAARLVLGAALVAAGLALVGYRARLACLVAGALELYWTGLNYSFSKVHHEKVSLAFALLALPLAPVGARLSVDALLRRVRRARGGLDPRVAPETIPLAGVPLKLVALTVAIGYGFAGWTKLRLRGLDWANGYTLMGILVRYDNDWSAFAVQSVELAVLASVVTLAVQGLFPLVLVAPATRWFFLPAAVGFHLVAWKTMDTGPYVTLWFLLIAYLPLERVPVWFVERARRGPVSAAGAAVAVGAPAALVASVFLRYLPAWTALFLLPLAARFVLPLVHRAPLPLLGAGRAAWTRALLAAADGCGLLAWEGDAPTAARPLRVRTPGGERAGPAAWRAVALRLPWTAPLAALLPRPRR